MKYIALTILLHFIVQHFNKYFNGALLKQIKFQYAITKKQLYRTDLLFQFNDSIKQTYTVENLLINAGYQINQLLQQSITIYVINQSKQLKQYHCKTISIIRLNSMNKH